jgi:transglutaminase-like putative cysteine protease
VTAVTAPRGLQLPAVVRRSLAPSEGWLSFGLVAAMALIVAHSIDDAGWVLGVSSHTDFLMPMAFVGAVVGLVTALSGTSRWLAHLTTAVLAAIVLPLIVGTIVPPGGGGLDDAFARTATSTRLAWTDLAVLNNPYTTQIGHHLLALGILAWGTGHFAAYTVFGHHRPLDAFIVLGLVLLTSMAATRNDQLWHLVTFSVIGLLLLTRHHALEEAGTWLRRRIGDPSAVRSLYQTGGSAFVVTAVVGSLVLTSTASSAPLQGAWAGFENWVIDVSRTVQRFLPLGGASRPIGRVVFSDQAAITGTWFPNDTEAFRVIMPSGEDQVFYWRTWVYDQISARGYSVSQTATVRREAGENVLSGLTDDPALQLARREVDLRFELLDYEGRHLVSPGAPVVLDRPAELVLIGPGRDLGAVDVGSQPGGYTMTASVPLIGDDDDPNGLTAQNLIAASEDYPAAVVAGYTDSGDLLGPAAEELLAEILELTPSRDPYHVAKTMEAFFRSSRFEYKAQVQAELAECGDASIVECFAITRKGYCQYYATTMAALLREVGIPARLATGFLPGERDERTGIEVVRNSESHLWVEVYFPGYGWVLFDPTGGGLGPGVPLPTGQPRSAPPTLPTGSGAVGEPPNRIPEDIDPGAGGTTRPPTSGGASPAVYIVIALLLAAAIVGTGFLAWRRGPRGEVGVEAAWRGISRLAARFGFGPRPTETVYEYAAALADALPQVRPELHTVANAKVEVAYGKRTLGDDRMRAIREAHRQLRVALLRLAFRRRERRGRRDR